MLFSTLKEHDAVFATIKKREPFNDLTTNQEAEIDGMYEAIQTIECIEPGIPELTFSGMNTINTAIEEVQKTTIEKVIEAIEYRIAETYAYLREQNYDDDGKFKYDCIKNN